MNLFFKNLLLACVVSLSFQVQAAEEKITLNFVNADMDAVIKAISKISGHNFLVDPRVRGTVNIVSGKPVSPALAYQILISALRMQGFAVVESGNITKILPEADAKTQPGPTGKGRIAQQGEQLITQVFQVRYESAAQLLNVIKPLISVNSVANANPGTNTLVITDYAANLKRIQQIIESIDVVRGDEPLLIPVKNVSAVEMAATLNRLFTEQAGGTAPASENQKVVIVADAKTNLLIVRADNPSKLARVRNLVEQMDIDADKLSNIHVITLKHAEAVRLAQTLRGILSGNETSTAVSNVSNAPAAGAAATTPTAGNTTVQVGGAIIQADSTTNSLIITAPEGIFRNLRGVIEQLDRRRAQVHIEALVVELSAERAAEFGVQWQDLSGIGKNKVSSVGGTNFGGSGTNIITAAQGLASVGKGLNIGIVNGKIDLPGLGTISNLGVLARFLETESQANILSTPNILTLDNEEAKIVIGQNVPFVTGSYAQTGSTATATPFQTYERKDVGLTLKVKPQITDGGIVRVQIYQEVSSVQSGTASSASGPTTNKRSLESNVLIDNGNIIALGGLMEDSQGTGIERVPLLGSIPYLGSLFRYENRQRKKTNLMVFLRPQIIRTEADYRKLSEKRYEQMRSNQEQAGKNVSGSLLSDSDFPQLPSLRLDIGRAPTPTPEESLRLDGGRTATPKPE